MSPSKINQSELKYSCGAGEARVNLFTGRLLFSHPDISIGISTYQVGISHIYDSKPSWTSKVNSNMGVGWKLNVQQYLYLENGVYVYIDGAGYRHDFENLIDNKYYDTTGLGLTLTVNPGGNEIIDEPGNKMIFHSDRLDRTVSCGESNIVKYFNYDSSGKLISVYDARKSEARINFTYDNVTGLLKKITCKNEEIEYFYNYEKHLLKITRTVDGITKIDSLFSYILTNLTQATYFENKSTLRFDYYGNEDKVYNKDKVRVIRTGIATLSVEKETKSLSYVGDDLYCGDNAYVGETYTVENYKNDLGATTLGEDKLSQYRIDYYENPNYTIVTNIINGTSEKDVKMIYYLNEEGYTNSVLEAHNGNNNDLRTLQKSTGIKMLNDTWSANYFNGQCITGISASTLSTSSLLSDCLVDMNNYINKYSNYRYYTCSFWLKLSNKVTNSKIKIIIWSYGSGYTSDISYKSFDNSAVGSWQFVSVPMHITYKEIESIHITIQENSNVYYEIADMRLCYNPASRICITNGIDSIPLDNITCIKYTAPSNPTVEESIDLINDSFITEIDLQLTYLRRFKSRGLSSTGDGFVLSYCNGTKKQIVNSVKLCIDEDKNNISEKEYPLVFNTIQNEEGGRAVFFHEIIFPDGNLTTRKYLYFIKDKYIEGKKYDCLRHVTEGRKIIDGSSPVISYTETFIDLKGKILKEVDEYDVETIYGYDSSGIQTSKTIQNKYNTSEKITITSSTSSVYNTTNNKDYKSDIVTSYNDPFGHVVKVEYNGNGEILDNKLITNFTYDRFNSKLKNIDNDIGGSNYLRYGGGKLLEVTPLGWDKDKSYGYKFGYNALGDPDKYYLTYKNGRKKEENLLLERSIDRVNGKITTRQYRDTPDTTTVQLDKYGRTTSVVELPTNKTTTFTRQNLSVSSGANEVEAVYDPYEDRTYVYSYDDFNNVTGYEIKSGGTEGYDFLTIKASGSNKTTYEGFTNTPYRLKLETEITHDKLKLLNPRVAKTEISVDSKSDETVYSYDQLGRINLKEYKVFDGVFGAYTSITESTTYNTGTLLKEYIRTKIDNPSSADTEYIFYNGYDSRGNITASKLTIKTTGIPDKECISNFSYDKANRLASEYNGELSGLTKYYTYNKDGSIDTESYGTIIKKYGYQNGKLVYYHDNTPQGNTKYFAYDNIGNCTHYMRNEASPPNMEWERGNLLKKYSGISNIIFSYNSQGIRFKKEISGGKTTTYYYDGLKLLGEDSGYLDEIKYIYDAEGIKGFKKRDIYSTYFYVKDSIGNIIAILDEDKEVAHYEYDAWGNCTITKDIGGIGTLNPFRWKSQYYDQESGLYLIPTTSGSRYYSPVMKSFISACNINEILYNINIPGNLNAYAIGNPMYFPVNSYNIFTSIPLVPENLGSDNNWNLPEWVKWTVGSIVIAGLWISVPFTGGSTLPMAIGATALGAGGLITAGFTSGWDIGSMASGYMAGSLLGAACGAAYMLAPSAAFAGVGNKFTADITAFAFFGKPIPLFDNFQWEGYAIAYTFGGMTKGIGSGLKFGLDVGLRPAVNQWVLMGTRGKDWSTEQYIVDVLIRGTTFGIENSFAKSMLRGYGSGLYWRIRQLFG